MKKCFVFICVVVMFSGCTRIMTDFAPFTIDPVTSQEEGILLTTGDINQPYKELGVIFVRGRCSSYGQLVEKLTAKAKEIGADAVIKIKFGKFRRSYRRHCRGVAVSFQ